MTFVLHQLAAGRPASALGAVLFLVLLAAGLCLTSDSGSHAEAATGGPWLVRNIKGGNCDDAGRPTGT